MIHSHWVHAFIIYQEKVLLLKRTAYKKQYPNERDLPWWTTADEETSEQTIYREIKEECGILPDSIIDIHLLGIEHMRDEDTQWYGTISFYYISVNNPSITLSHEHTAYAWVELDQLHTYLPQRTIVGICLGLYNEYRKNI
jgi:ADP-ribose pyrophosphatase YjhB (NUDIX family)